MGLRRLRGLRAQLLLWTILPLAVVLIILSVAGVSRHRQAMTALVADRDRGLALAEATRLGHEVDQRVQMLARLAAAPAMPDAGAGLDTGGLDDLSTTVSEPFGAGLALVDGQGGVLAASAAAEGWAASDAAVALAARVAGGGQSALAEATAPDGASLLLVGVPTASGAVLAGGLPTESLHLAESNPMLGGEAHAAMFVLDAGGRLIHHNNPHDLAVDETALAGLPLVTAGGVGLVSLPRRAGQDLLVAYAPVEPPGWTLAVVEDVHAVGAFGLSAVEALPLLLLFVAVVALLAVSFGVANVVRPLQDLDRRAARVAWGDFDAVKAPVGGVQEIDDLRITLVQMADRIRSYQTGMRDYLSAVTQAQEEERSRLAHELHDDTVQALIALKQRAQMAHKALVSDPERAASRLDELEGLIDQELAALRRLIGDLRPIYLEDLGFVPALDMLTRATAAREGLSIQLDVQGETVRLAPDVELTAFRIVQQALSNVVAHAGAQNAWVTVHFAAGGLTLTVRDDGRGFTPPEQPTDLARQGHFGLMGMRERAMLYGGQLTVVTAPGKGTTITAWLPLS